MGDKGKHSCVLRIVHSVLFHKRRCCLSYINVQQANVSLNLCVMFSAGVTG